MYVGICDDNANDLNKVKSIVSHALFDVCDINIITYSTGEDVLRHIEKGDFNCELLLLDIFMEPVDGMSVAEYIRENSIDVDIIFVTNSVEHVYEGYTYKAFAYILKDSMSEKLPVAIRRYVEEISSAEEYLNITSDGAIRHVPISKILYIQSDARKLNLYLKNQVISFYGKMSEVEELLADKGFVRIHQSYMVKMNMVEKYTKSVVHICDQQLPVSRKYASNLQFE